MRSSWSYVTGAVALMLSLVLFVLATKDETRSVWYIVGGGVCLLSGTTAIALGASASRNRRKQTPTPFHSDPTTDAWQRDDFEASVTDYNLAPKIKDD